MRGKVCSCGSTHCYISLYWKGKNYTFRRDTQGRVLDYREASVALIKINSEINDPYVKFNPVDWTDLQIRERKFEHQIEKWLKEKETEEKNGELSYGTLRDYKGYVRNHFGTLQRYDVRDIDLGVLSDFKNSLVSVGIKTRKNIIDALHVFMVWLKKKGVITEIPQFPEVKGYAEKPYRAINYEAQCGVLERIPDKHRDIIHFLMETGILALCIMLFSCSTCRYLSVQDARHYQSQGYQTRICVYPVGTDGLIMGLGIWTHHAQAQVKVNGEWKWVGNGLQDEPEYSIDGEIDYWQVGIYEAYLRMMGRLN